CSLAHLNGLKMIHSLSGWNVEHADTVGYQRHLIVHAGMKVLYYHPHTHRYSAFEAPKTSSIVADVVAHQRQLLAEREAAKVAAAAENAFAVKKKKRASKMSKREKAELAKLNGEWHEDEDGEDHVNDQDEEDGQGVEKKDEFAAHPLSS